MAEAIPDWAREEDVPAWAKSAAEPSQEDIPSLPTQFITPAATQEAMTPEEMSRTGQTSFEPNYATAGTELTKISEALRANVQPMLEHPIDTLTGMFTNWDDIKHLYEQPQDIIGPTAKRALGMEVRPEEEIGSQDYYNNLVGAALIAFGMRREAIGKAAPKGEPSGAPPVPEELARASEAARPAEAAAPKASGSPPVPGWAVNQDIAPDKGAPAPAPEEVQPQLAANVREALSLDELRLMRERSDLQLQKDMLARANVPEQMHAGIDARLEEINGQLDDIANQELAPSAGEPVPAAASLPDVSKLQQSVAEFNKPAESSAVNEKDATHVRLINGDVKPLSPLRTLGSDEIGLADGNSVSRAAVKYFFAKSPKGASVQDAFRPLGESAGQQRADLQQPAGVGNPTASQISPSAGRDPVGIANRYVEDAIARGDLPQEALQHGSGWNPFNAQERGARLIEAGVDPKEVADRIERSGQLGGRFKTFRGTANLSAGDAVSVLHAEVERLAAERQNAQDLAAKQPMNPKLAQTAKAAEDAELAFLNRAKPLAGGAVQRAMTAFQGARPVDLSTHDGLYREAIKINGGKPVPENMKVEIARRATRTQNSIKGRDALVSRIGKEIDKTLPKVETPTRESLGGMIESAVRDLTPCK